MFRNIHCVGVPGNTFSFSTRTPFGRFFIDRGNREICSFCDQSGDALRDLQTENYVGVGNDRLKLSNVIDDLMRKRDLRDDQELLFRSLSKTQMLKAVRELRTEDADVPNARTLQAMSTTDLVLLLTLS